MLKKLARKHRSTAQTMATRFKAKVITPHGPRSASKQPPSTRAKTTGCTIRWNAAETGLNTVVTDRVPTGSSYPQKELLNPLSKVDANSARQ